MIEISDWQALAEMTVAPSPKRVSDTERRERQKMVNAKLLGAIENADLPGALLALEQGANVNAKRSGRNALWWSLRQGHWSIAEALMAKGADHAFTTTAGYSLLSAIAHRDDPSEARRLVALGFDAGRVRREDFFHDDNNKSYPHLFEWWVNEAGGHLLEESSHVYPGRDAKRLLIVGADGSPELRAQINQALNFDGKDPSKFLEHLPITINAAHFWGAQFAKNDIPRIQSLLKSGWGFYRQESHPRHNLRVSTWLSAHRGAWDTFEWLCSNPNFKAAALADAKANPATTWWEAATTVAAMEKIQALGVDLRQTLHGRTLLSDLARSYPDRKHLLSWFLEYHRDMFDMGDDRGKTPREQLHEGAWEELNAAVVRRNTKRSGAKAPTGPKRRL